ncbi:MULTISPECIES: hypothetical protein [Pirellulaceae]|nr:MULTISPECIES: hypothetical protein [Pirellulaceae]
MNSSADYRDEVFAPHQMMWLDYFSSGYRKPFDSCMVDSAIRE